MQLCSTTKNVLDIQCITTKSGEFSQNLLENKIPGKNGFKSRVSMATPFSTESTQCLVNFGIFIIGLRILKEHT